MRAQLFLTSGAYVKDSQPLNYASKILFLMSNYNNYLYPFV